jgi:hypothetical protein
MDWADVLGGGSYCSRRYIYHGIDKGEHHSHMQGFSFVNYLKD